MKKITYADSGVDITEGNRAVELMKAKVKETYTSGVVGDIGLFAGGFSLGDVSGMEEPVLLASTDGVGTKIMIAQQMDVHDTVGIDLVAMCVNDLICQGAKPLFFLDYIATGNVQAEKIATIVGGIADGCKESLCALIGGETAEMPGFYPVDEYDLAGFCVGVADKCDLIDGKDLKTGDSLIGIASSGVHSNGFSLVRKVFDMTKESLNTYYEELNKTLGEVLLAPTKIYVKALKSVKENGIKIKACSHITGGGFYENIPRMLTEDKRAVVKKDSYKVPAIFTLMAKKGDISEEMMYNTFNMGIGMVIAVDKGDVEKTLDAINKTGEKAFEIGYIDKGTKGIELI